MSSLDEFDLFARIVRAGSLSAAGRDLGMSPAMVSKRLVRLEERLGVRLLYRSTRRLGLTDVGRGFYERIVPILAAVEEAEGLTSGRSGSVRGRLRVSAPTSFGRMHLAPHLNAFLSAHPDLRLELNLTDTFVDLVAEGIDVALRIAALEDSSLVAQRLAPNRRVLCASPQYLQTAGEPADLDALQSHRLLAAVHQTPWRLMGPQGLVSLRVESFIRTNSSEVVREAAVASLGIAMRSTWDVSKELREGRLKIILPEYTGSSDVGIFAVFPSRHLVPPKVRNFVQFMAGLYGPKPYWDNNIEV